MGMYSSKIKSIITINAYEEKYYTLKQKQLRPLKKLDYNSSNFTASYVSNKDLISASIELSRSIPSEDILDIIEIKAYEELGLDQANEYTIKYIERESTNDIRILDIFVVESEKLKGSFKSTVEKIKYIDLLVPSPLLYRSLYSSEMLASEDVHCFVYFGQNDTFVTFYKDSKYLYAKSIPYSLKEIYDKYCELIGDGVNEEEFFNILESEGLKTIHTDYQENFMKLFGDIFISINDIIIYVKRAYDLSSIDQIFIGGVRGPIIGLDEYCQNYLGLQSFELNFDFNLELDEWYVDQLQCMLAIASMDYMEDTEEVVNLTVFQRAPAFQKRASGQFIIATSMAIMAGISYPSYFLVSSYLNSATNLLLSKNETELQAESGKYKEILGAKKDEIKKLDEKIASSSKIYHSKEKTLVAIHSKKVNYQLKSGLLYDFANDISQFGVNVSNMSSINNSFTFSLVSKDEKEITKLIKHISGIHFDKIISIDIEMISKDPESEFYFGILKVVLR